MCSTTDEVLIAEVKKRRGLYDPNHDVYKDSSKKLKVWQEVGSKVGLTGLEASRRFKAIRDGLVKSFHKIRIQEEMGAKTKPYKYRHLLNFIIPYVKVKPSDSVLPDSLANVEDHLVVNSKEDLDISPGFSRRDGLDESRDKSFLVGNSRKRKLECDEIIGEISAYQVDDRLEDENDIFFRSMAQICKKLPQHLQVMARFRIHSVVHDIELESLTSV